MIGTVVSYNAATGTATIQPSIKARVTAPDGSTSWVSMQPLPNVPVVFMGGGNFVATFPVQPGDEALVIFCSRCIAAWFQSGGQQVQAEMRMHDLSDGIAIIGPRSKARAIPNLSTASAQLRSLDGSVVADFAPSGITLTAPKLTINSSGDVDITAQGNVNIQGQKITETSSGNNTTIDGKAFLTHLHSGVQSGGSDTGPVA